MPLSPSKLPLSVPLSNMSSPTHDSSKSSSDPISKDECDSVGLIDEADEQPPQSSMPTNFLPAYIVRMCVYLNCGCASYINTPYITVGILCFINLINYMDRFTIAGVLEQVENFYSLSDTEGGLIQTSFIICYMIMAPIFGYLGDRYNRSYIMAGGVFFWSTTTLMGSFIPADYFGGFIFLRALVGTGEASYSTIAPTILADLFQGSLRTKMLAVFYFAIPIGSGLGYIVGSNVAAAMGQWQWALRVTPALGILATILIVLFVKDPPRGESDGGAQLESTPVKEDLKDLSRNYSFVLSTAGFTCVAFATGALAWWAPYYFHKASKVYGHEETLNEVSLKFGVITCLAGLTGVFLGSMGAQFYRRYNDRADPLICAAGVLLSAPTIFLGCVIAHKMPALSYTLIFFGEMFLCVNWPIVADILLYVVVPTRRSIAEAVQILLSHTLGDAFSPYIIGAISDNIKARKRDTILNDYLSLQYAMYITCFVLVLGGGLFFMTTHFIVQDRERCRKMMSSESDDQASVASELPFPVEANNDPHTDDRQLIS